MSRRVRVCAQFDQTDELAVWDVSRPNTRGRSLPAYGKRGVSLPPLSDLSDNYFGHQHSAMRDRPSGHISLHFGSGTTPTRKARHDRQHTCTFST
jgi:hypothetical protein